MSAALHEVSDRWPRFTKPVVCIATGPSLTPQQIVWIQRAHEQGRVSVIAVNHAGLPNVAPWSDVWYAADDEFWRHYEAVARRSTALKIGAETWAEDERVTQLRLRVRDKYDERCHEIGYALHGLHSGFQALQLALNGGAMRVLLVGYDCRPRRDGLVNFFGKNEVNAAVTMPKPFELWRRAYAALRPPEGASILNCTPGSAIDAFPFADLDRVL